MARNAGLARARCYQPTSELTERGAQALNKTVFTTRFELANSPRLVPCFNPNFDEGRMSRKHHLCASAAAAVLWAGSAQGDQVKQFTIEQGKATIVADFVSPRPDCSSNPGPQPLPALSQKPLHGRVGMQIGATNIPANGNCPARKIASVAIFYLAPKDFVGADNFQIEVDEDNDKKNVTTYQVTVKTPDSKP